MFFIEQNPVFVRGVFQMDSRQKKTHDFSQNHGTGDRIRHILYHLQEHKRKPPQIRYRKDSRRFRVLLHSSFSGDHDPYGLE